MAIRRGERVGVRPAGRHGALRGRRAAVPGARGGREPHPGRWPARRRSPSRPTTRAQPLTELDRAVDILVEMKNSAPRSPSAWPTRRCCSRTRPWPPRSATLEARSDILHDELESWVLKAAPEAPNTDELRGLLRLAYAGEMIFDAARDMTWLVEQGEELHPVDRRWRSRRPRRSRPRRSSRPGRAPRAGRSRSSSSRRRPGCSSWPSSGAGGGSTGPGRGPSCRRGDRVISIGPEEGVDELEALTPGARSPTGAPRESPPGRRSGAGRLRTWAGARTASCSSTVWSCSTSVAPPAP